MMKAEPATSIADDARRAFVLNDRPLIVDLIELTLNHGLFVVRAAQNFAEAEAILETWRPDIAVLDMDHEDSPQVLHRLGASNTLRPSATPVLGLTRRGDLATKLRAFDLGVDDILTIPFSPEELLARRSSSPAAILATGRPLVRRSPSARWRSTSSIARSGRAVGRAPDAHRAEPAVPAGQPRRASRDARGDPRRLWGTDFVAESNVVDRHIRSLRIKLQNDYRRPRFIATVPGEGIASFRPSRMRLERRSRPSE